MINEHFPSPHKFSIALHVFDVRWSLAISEMRKFTSLAQTQKLPEKVEGLSSVPGEVTSLEFRLIDGLKGTEKRRKLAMTMDY